MHSPQEADQHLEWRGGLAQKREAEERARRMVEEVRDAGCQKNHHHRQKSVNLTSDRCLSTPSTHGSSLCPHCQAKGPFARYEHDREHEDMLRSKSRFGDPFAHLGAGKRAVGGGAEPAALTERYDVEALEKSGVWACCIDMQGKGDHSPGLEACNHNKQKWP